LTMRILMSSDGFIMNFVARLHNYTPAQISKSAGN